MNPQPQASPLARRAMTRSGDRWVGAAAPNTPVTVTVLLRSPAGLSEQLLSGQYHPESRENAERNMAADPQDLAAVHSFAKQHGLTVQSDDPASHRVVLAGTVQQMDKAFGVQIGEVQDTGGHSFRSFQGEMQLPPDLQGAVTAVLGLDQRPVARHALQH